MIEGNGGGQVLQTGRPAEAAEALRRRLDRRNILLALITALLFHLLIVLGFYLVDVLGIRDISDWSGPVLVKIGAPDGVDSREPDPGPLPEEIDTPVEEIPDEPVLSPEVIAPSEATAPAPEKSSEGVRPEAPLETAEGGSGTTEKSPFQEPSSNTQPVPARAEGNEDGNNYLVNFDGSDDEVGRAYSLDFVTSYMPMPQELPSEIIERAKRTRSKSVFTYDDLIRYWEPDSFDLNVYRRVGGLAGFIRPADRPFFWSYLEELGYNLADADWHEFAEGAVIVEFKVVPSDRGAFLNDFKLIQGTENPEVNQAIQYGLSQWNYYNTTDRPIKGTLTYRFDR